jgi:L-fuculose-phosphate aldolase
MYTRGHSGRIFPAIPLRRAAWWIRIRSGNTFRTMSRELQLRNEIVRFGRLLHEHGFSAARDGNLSCRLNATSMLITPTGLSKGMLETDDIIVADMQGRKIAGPHEVSSEIQMHVLIYGMRPDVGGVCHAHPPTATGFAVAGIAIDEPVLAEAAVVLGPVPVAPYGTPGTPELAASLEPFVTDHDAILMSNHGVVCCAPDLLQAYLNLELVEQAARTLLVARQLGGPRPLSADQAKKLRELRDRMRAANQPVTADKY